MLSSWYGRSYQLKTSRFIYTLCQKINSNPTTRNDDDPFHQSHRGQNLNKELTYNVVNHSRYVSVTFIDKEGLGRYVTALLSDYTKLKIYCFSDSMNGNELEEYKITTTALQQKQQHQQDPKDNEQSPSSVTYKYYRYFLPQGVPNEQHWCHRSSLLLLYVAAIFNKTSL